MKKEENIVGIVPAKISVPKKRNTGAPTMYWRSLVKIWFDLYGELIPPPPGEEIATPSFDTVETAQMKIILKELRQRAEDKNVLWTEVEAKKRWEAFLRKAWEDDFISKNFMLKIISNRKGLIFNNQITPKKNGSETNITNIGKRSTPTSDSKIRALKNWGVSVDKGNDKR